MQRDRRLPVSTLVCNCSKDPSSKRVKRWAFSLRELLKDPIGRENFMRFLEKEVSGENLR